MLISSKPGMKWVRQRVKTDHGALSSTFRAQIGRQNCKCRHHHKQRKVSKAGLEWSGHFNGLRLGEINLLLRFWHR